MRSTSSPDDKRTAPIRPAAPAALHRAEAILWSLLRNRRLDGLKFRRQVPLLGHTVDFICIDRKLIVEIDGRQHCWEADDDAARTEEIERHSFRVVRFGNAEVVDDRDAVIAAIRRAICG